MRAGACLLACLALLLAACASQPAARETLLSGTTMGSAWTVKVVGPVPPDLQAGIQSHFEAVDRALSTWRADSALSRFNASSTDDWQDVDPELALVMDFALKLAEPSEGAYDITVGPLVNLWGFGPDPARYAAPEPAAIAAARARVGWHKVQVDQARQRARKPPEVYVDLSSLGKGRGVDRVAEYLDARGIEHYLIDLSGKLRARGRNASGQPWRIAVEQPTPDVSVGSPALPPAIVTLRDASIATAGDYRRYFESAGRHYSHIIDPRTGEPVTHRTVSATALSADCLSADAWATVLMVMPPEQALALAERRGLAALLVAREPGKFRLQPSSAWQTPR